MPEHKSEDTIIFLAFSPDHTESEVILDYLGNFFIRKSSIDPSDRFNIITFNEYGPVRLQEFTHYGEELFLEVKRLIPRIKNVNLSEGISIAINLILDVFKNITGKVYRLIIITDETTPPLEISDYLRDLTNQIATFPFIIDILRIDTNDRHEDKVLMHFIKPTHGTMYYYENEDDAGNVLYDLAEKKSIDKSVLSDSSASLVTDDNRGLLDYIAIEPEPLPQMAQEFDTIRCQICGLKENLCECPQCGVTYHKECLAHWAEYSKIGRLLPNVFRCPNCFRLLRLDAAFVDAVQQGKDLKGDAEVFIHNASVMGDYNQELLLKENDVGFTNFIEDNSDKNKIDLPDTEENKDYSLFEGVEDIELVTCPQCGRITTNEFNVCSSCGGSLLTTGNTSDQSINAPASSENSKPFEEKRKNNSNFFKFPMHWTESYRNQFSRNIGLVSMDEQDIIKNSKIAILGTGGVGAPVAIQLTYSGCENFVICDYDKVEESNLNRQPFYRSDIGSFKVDALKSQLQEINPDVLIEVFYKVDQNNIADILKNVDIIVLSLDGPSGSILVSRYAKTLSIPMVESWAIPYLFSWWFTDESPSYEEVYELNTQNFSMDEIDADNNLLKSISQKFIALLLKFPGIGKRFDREPGALDNLLSGKIPLRSFAPIAWLNASYLAYDIIYSGIIKTKKMNLAPNLAGFDYSDMSLF